MTSAAAPRRRKPRKISTRDDLSGLLVVKLGRKSTPDPRNPGKSVDDQLVYIDRDCERYGLVEFARIEEDRQGASRWSKRTQREKFEEAMRIIATEPIAVFAVNTLSRSARRLMTHGRMVELLEDRNTLLMERGRLLDMSVPGDRAQVGITAVMDENQVAVSRLDTMRGLDSAARAGRPHGPMVYGYARQYDPHTRALISVIIVEEEAKIIREAIDRILRGESMRAIAADFTKRDIPRPRGAQQWYPKEIRLFAENVTYAGKRSHTIFRTDDTRIYDAMWPAILDEEKQCRALAILDSRTNNSRDRKDAKYMLTGIIKCTRCDLGPLFANRQSSTRKAAPESVRMVYFCHKCKRTRNMGHVDEYVRDVVNMWLQNEKLIKRYASASIGISPQLVTDRAALAEAIYELNAAYGTKMSARALAAMEAQWQPEIDRLTLRVQAAEAGQQQSGWVDVAAAEKQLQVPEDVNEARLFLSRLIRVHVLESPQRGHFSPKGLRIIPLGMPE